MKETIIRWAALSIPWLMSHGSKILVIIACAYFLNKIIYKFIERIVKTTVIPDDLSSKDSEKKREYTLIRIFSAAMKISIITMAGLMILQEMGIMIGPILAGAGIVGLALGFGGQYLIRDIISGLFIILENQYRIGDVVCFDNTCGLVEDISLRATVLRDLNGTVHHVPHGEIKKVANHSKTFARVNLNIRVAYDSKLEDVIEVINQTGKELASDSQWKEFIIQPPQFLRVEDFSDSAIILKILGETIPLKQWDITGELRKRIKIAFDKRGIEIPFPQRVIHQAKKKYD
ncbi:MAG TPA: mechanosensitive ion channel family protein [Bacteroidia bacterium]|nr:mechanosensitive ion channel family protein [Bacteroidia bacterium]